MAANATQPTGFSRFSRTGQVLFGILLVGLILIAYWLIFYWDLSDGFTRSESQFRALQQQLANAKKNEAAYQKDLAEYHQREQREIELQKVLPETASYPTFLSSLQGVANVSGVSLIAWSPGAESFESFYVKVPLKLSLSGKFHQIARFFYGVSRLDRIINIEEISLADPKRIDGDLRIQAECLAVAFRSLSVEEAKSGKTAVQRGSR